VTGVASFILLADIGDQRLRTLHLNFEGGDQRVFRVNDNVSRVPLKFKANRKLHLCGLPISVKSRRGQSKRIQWLRLFTNYTAVGLIFHHCLCALFGSLFLPETYFGLGSGLIRSG
jgi:hypothetical protein